MTKVGPEESPSVKALPFHPVEAIGCAAVVGFYLLTVLPNIANNPIVGGDEGWIISASAKLARGGTFGSDLFAGFYGAERHYYFNLPLHHLVLAGVFKVFGAGIVQARLVSVAFGLVALLLTWALGRRLGGPAFGLAAAGLFGLLRLNLAPFTGLTLTDLGATVRYDLIALPYGLAAVLLLARRPAPGLPEAALAGLLLGLASLTQFIGAFFLPPLFLFILTLALPLSRRLLLVGMLIAFTLLPFLPYAAYVSPHWPDFQGQARTAEQQTDLFSPSFYRHNMENEPDRFKIGTGITGLPAGLRATLRRPSARLALFVIGPAAALYVAYRAIQGSQDHRLLAFLLIGMSLEFALLESTKRFVYWVIIVPFLCLAIADLGLALWRPSCRLTGTGRPLSGRSMGQSFRLPLRALEVAVAAVFALEGIAVGLKNVRTAANAQSYSEVGAAVASVVPPGAVVAGDNRLWLTLSQDQPRSLHLLFYETNPRISRDRITDVAGAMGRINADYLLLSPLTREILMNLSPNDSADFVRYLETNASLVATVLRPPYGPIEVYKLKK